MLTILLINVCQSVLLIHLVIMAQENALLIALLLKVYMLILTLICVLTLALIILMVVQWGKNVLEDAKLILGVIH